MFGRAPAAGAQPCPACSDGRSRALPDRVLLGMLANAAATDALGLHAVFGAFLFGAALPRDNRLLETLIERIELSR